MPSAHFLILLDHGQSMCFVKGRFFGLSNNNGFLTFPVLPILINFFFTYCVRFYCATNSYVEHIVAFVLNTCCQSKICLIVGLFVGTIS